MKNRLLALILSLVSAAALALSASAAQTHEVPVTLTMINNEQRISVTVPAALPVSVVDGYVVTATGRGYGGDMSVMVGLDASGAITGTKVLSHGESQGIGTVVTDDGSAFQQQLIGMTDATGIQATSGATVSSNGTVTYVGKGTTTLTCTVDGQTLTCTVRCT